MKKIALCFLASMFVVAFTSGTIFGQESIKEEKKEAKAEKKRIKEEKELAEWEETRDMAVKRQFVFKATHLYTSRGSISLDSKINFFYVLDDYAVFQFALDGYITGGNGVVGVTNSGHVESYVVKGETPKKIVQVEVTVMPHAAQGVGISPFIVKFYGDGYGELIMTNTGQRMKGKIEKPDSAIIYEGNKQ